MTYRERRERRAAKRREWAETQRTRAESGHRASAAAVEHIPLGQPILAGHHSERRHRRDLRRGEGEAPRTGRGDSRSSTRPLRLRRRPGRPRTARSSNRRADGPPRTHESRQRLAPQERRAAARGTHPALRGRHLARRRRRAPGLPHTLRPNPRRTCDLTQALTYSYHLGYPPYALSNLGAAIRRDQKRLRRLRA